MKRSLGAILGGRQAVLLLSLGVGFSGLLAIVLIAAIAAGFGSSRTFVLEAQATGLHITFSGQANDWALGKVVVCTPRAKIAPSLSRGSGQCDARRYLEVVVENLRINWNSNASIDVTSYSPGTLVLDISGQVDFVDRTRVILSSESWASAGALTFNGTAQVGDQLASGETKMVLSGHFEAREKPFWSDNTEVLKSGLIRRGESVAVVREGANGFSLAEVYGHITPVGSGSSGFLVGIVSAPGPVLLQLGFFGGATPTQIAPNWMDRALTSPLILALAALLSVFLGSFQIVGNSIASLLPLLRQEQVASSQGKSVSEGRPRRKFRRRSRLTSEGKKHW